jgi:hypothetical protein
VIRPSFSRQINATETHFVRHLSFKFHVSEFQVGVNEHFGIVLKLETDIRRRPFQMHASRVHSGSAGFPVVHAARVQAPSHETAQSQCHWALQPIARGHHCPMAVSWQEACTRAAYTTTRTPREVRSFRSARGPRAVEKSRADRECELSLSSPRTCLPRKLIRRRPAGAFFRRPSAAGRRLRSRGLQTRRACGIPSRGSSRWSSAGLRPARAKRLPR